jgi:hypothetical protein
MDYSEMITLLESFNKDELEAMLLFLKAYMAIKKLDNPKRGTKKGIQSSNVTKKMIEERILASKPPHEETDVEYQQRRYRIVCEIQEENGGWNGKYKHLL